MDERASGRRNRASRTFRGVLTLGLLCVSISLPAQVSRVDVLPIPATEQFSRNDALAVSLRVRPARVRIDETPTFTVSVTNVSPEPVLVRPSIVANVQIYTTSDELIQPSLVEMASVWYRLTTLDEAIELAPGEGLTAEVAAKYAGMTATGGRLYGSGRGLDLPPGEYLARFAYVNYPDYPPQIYDVRTDRASRMWEGRIESPPVPLTIEGPDADGLPALLVVLRNMVPGTPAYRLAGAALAEMAAPLRQLYLDDPSSRDLIVLAIAATGDAAAADWLLDVFPTHPARWSEPYLLVRDVASQLVALAPSCDRVPWLVEHWPQPSGGGDSSTALLALDARCPDLRSELREILLSAPSYDSALQNSWWRIDRRRAAAAAFLAQLDGADAVADLSAALLEPAPDGRLAGAFDTMHRRVASELARIGGPAAATALLEAAARPASDSVRRTLATAIATMSPSDADVALAGLLSSMPAAAPSIWIGAAARSPADAVVSQLEALLDHSDADVQRHAIRALGPASWPAVRGRIVDLATTHRRTDVRAAAIDYLVARRDPSVVTLLGTADDARRLRQELEQTDDEDRIPSLAYDLRRLTFASEDPQFGLSRRDWDAWFMGRDGQTRTDWAQEAIARATATPSPPATPAGALAVEYLARLPDPPLAMLRGATTSPSWNVRVAASSALLEWDEPAAIRLLAREFQNRYVRACLAAAQALVRVAEPFPVDCTDPASRSAAAAFYARESR